MGSLRSTTPTVSSRGPAWTRGGCAFEHTKCVSCRPLHDSAIRADRSIGFVPHTPGIPRYVSERAKLHPVRVYVSYLLVSAASAAMTTACARDQVTPVYD